MTDFPGGKVHIDGRADGAVRVEFGSAVMVMSPQNTIEFAKALLKQAGVEIVLAEPGQTVIRPPERMLVSN